MCEVRLPLKINMSLPTFPDEEGVSLNLEDALPTKAVSKMNITSCEKGVNDGVETPERQENFEIGRQQLGGNDWL
jgi:hypothetical protein